MLVSPITSNQRSHESASENAYIDLSDILAFLRRYAVTIAGFALAGMATALFMATTSDPIYSAGAQILIEPKLPQYMQQQNGGVSTSLDTAQVESQIAMMQSEKIAHMVIDQLSLMDDPDFFILDKLTLGQRAARFVQTVQRKLGAGGPEAALAPGQADRRGLSDFERGRLAIAIFGGNLDIRRVGVSYAINITYRSRNAELAAQIANATADSFVREQIETKAEAARAGGSWLEQRMSELRSRMTAATQIAQEFRARHDYRVRPPAATIVNGQVVYDDESNQASGEPTLEELEVTADTYRKMYESFLLAYTSNLSQQSYPIPDARVITAATRPLSPSYPRKKLVLAFGLVAGLTCGLGVAFVRNTLDGSLRSPRQIQERLGLKFLGALPARRGGTGGIGTLDEVVTSPRSAASDVLRRAKFAIRLAGEKRPTTSVAFASALGDEGRSVVVSNLALLYAMSGQRTLVIDADEDFSRISADLLRRRSGEMTGSVDLVTGSMLAGRPVQAVATGYDFVILNLPPLGSGPEALAASNQVNCTILVAESGESPVAAVGELASVLDSHGASIIGVLLTRGPSVGGRRLPRARRIGLPSGAFWRSHRT